MRVDRAGVSQTVGAGEWRNWREKNKNEIFVFFVLKKTKMTDGKMYTCMLQLARLETISGEGHTSLCPAREFG